MPAVASPRLRLEKQATGENTNTWGVRLNDGGLELIDQAIAGVTTKAVTGAAALTATNFAADEARSAVLRLTGDGGTLTIPAVQKVYLVDNACTGAVTITAGAGAAVVQPGEVAPIYCDGVVVRRIGIRNFGDAVLKAAADPVDATDIANRRWVLAQIGAVAQSLWLPRTSAIVAAAGDRILADTSAGAWTLTLPPTPTTGMEVQVIDARATWHTNALTIARNGATIADLAEDLICDLRAARVSLVYTGATWAVG
jgi:hypothetical protein